MQTEDDNAGKADELALEPLSYLRVASALVQNMMQSSISQVQQSEINEDVPMPPPTPVQLHRVLLPLIKMVIVQRLRLKLL